MQFSTLFLAAVSALTVSAAPSQNVEERSCKYLYPESDGYVWVSRYYNPDYANTEKLTFRVPPGSAGACDLKVHFDSAYPPALWGNTQVDFKYLGGTGTTYTFRPGPLDSYVGSFGCRDVMEFELTISPEQGKPGYVGFPQHENSGLYMVYGC